MKSICIASFLVLAVTAGSASAATTINGSKSNSSDRYRSSEVDDDVAKTCPAGFDFDKSNKQCRRVDVSKSSTTSLKRTTEPVKTTGGSDDGRHIKLENEGATAPSDGGNASGEKYVPVRRTASKTYSSVTAQQGRHETALGGPDTSQKQRLPTGTGNAGNANSRVDGSRGVWKKTDAPSSDGTK